MNISYSVLMSVYKKENPTYFRESINSMLNQTVKPNEIVIVKDGELTDELDSVLKDLRDEPNIKIISLTENKGLGEALNIGIKYCSNELIARMDTDDISRLDRCEKQLEKFMENKKLSIVSSFVYEFVDNKNDIKSIKKVPIIHSEIIKYSKYRNPFNHPAVMYKKTSVESAGGYKHFELFEDYYLWARMIMNGAICENIAEPLLFMRANSNMYKRRGGITYFKCILQFKWHLKRIGYYSLRDFIISTAAQGLIALVPNEVRKFIYIKLLRSKT